MSKTYIGDSVYCEFDGFQIRLTTENGYGPSNEIFLEDQVVNALLRQIEKYYGVKITVEKVKPPGESDELS